MTLQINMNAGAAMNAGIGIGLLTPAGNPWSLPDAIAREAVNRSLATPIGWPSPVSTVITADQATALAVSTTKQGVVKSFFINTVSPTRPSAYYGLVDGTDITATMQDVAAHIADDKTSSIEFGAGNYTLSGPVDFSKAQSNFLYQRWGQSAGTADRNSPLIQGTPGGTVFLSTLVGGPALRFAASPSVVRDIIMRGPGVANANTCAIQIGGVSTSGLDGSQGVLLERIAMQGFASCVRADDVTLLTLRRCLMERTNFGLEATYNCDQLRAELCEFGGVQPNQVAVTVSSGSNTVTVGTANAIYLDPGMAVGGARIADLTTITSVDAAGGTIVLSALPTSSGTTSLDFSQGWSIAVNGAASEGGGPWVPGYSRGAGLTGAQNIITMEGCWNMRVRGALWAPASSASHITIQHNYFERGYQVFSVGNANGNKTPGPFRLLNNHFSQPETYRHVSPFEFVGPGFSYAVQAEIKGNKTDSAGNAALPKKEWLNCQYAAHQQADMKLEWEGNTLPVDTSVVQYGPIALSGFRGDNIANMDRVYLGGRTPGNYSWLPGAGSGPGGFDWITGLDGIAQTINSNATIPNPGSVYPVTGRPVTVLLTQDATGGRTVTFGSGYIVSGTGFTGQVFAAGTGGQAALFEFKSNGSKLFLQNVPKWG